MYYICLLYLYFILFAVHHYIFFLSLSLLFFDFVSFRFIRCRRCARFFSTMFVCLYTAFSFRFQRLFIYTNTIDKSFISNSIVFFLDSVSYSSSSTFFCILYYFTAWKCFSFLLLFIFTLKSVENWTKWYKIDSNERWQSLDWFNYEEFIECINKRLAHKRFIVHNVSLRIDLIAIGRLFLPPIRYTKGKLWTKKNILRNKEEEEEEAQTIKVWRKILLEFHQ